MKTMPSAVLVFLIACCSSQEREPASDTIESKVEKRFEVKIGPEKLNLDFSSTADGAEKMTFTIINRTQETQVFNRFYACWRPILILESGEELILNGGSDHFREPIEEEYPSIPSGESRNAQVSINLYSSETKRGLGIKADYGTWFSTPISVGRYKLCIEYDNRESEWLREKRIELGATDVVEGTKRSNVIDVVVSD